MKQQSVGRHVAPLWNIIMISSRPVFALISYYYCVLSGKAANAYFIVFDFTLHPAIIFGISDLFLFALYV